MKLIKFILLLLNPKKSTMKIIYNINYHRNLFGTQSHDLMCGKEQNHFLLWEYVGKSIKIVLGLFKPKRQHKVTKQYNNH